jgi:hypothetical protein
MLKTAIEMFTITSLPSGSSGSYCSKFEAQNETEKTYNIRWEGS